MRAVLDDAAPVALGLERAGTLEKIASGIFSRAAMPTPVDVTKEALAHLEEAGADAVPCAGGGATIGLGRALAFRIPLAQVALPTTYTGSTCTSILGQMEHGVKTMMKGDALRPGLVIYDAEPVVSLPPAMKVTSELKPMGQAVEALDAPDGTNASDALAPNGLAACTVVFAEP
jgi:maleylacetate reductase